MKALSFNYSCEREAFSVRVKVRDLSVQCSVYFGNVMDYTESSLL